MSRHEIAPSSPLTKAEDPVAKALRASSDGFSISGLHDGRFVEVNEAWLRMTGYERDEVIGRSAFELGLWEDPGERATLVELLERGESVSGMPMRLRSKSGEVRDLLITFDRIALGTEPHMLSVCRDVTDLRVAQASFDHLNQLMGLILESAGEGIYGLDSAGAITFANDAVGRMLGWDPEELIGRRMHDLCHHSRPNGTLYPEEECPIYAAFREGETRRVDDDVFWRRDGSSFLVDYTSTPMRAGGRVTGAVVTFRDISERARLQREARESEDRYRALVESSPDAIAVVVEGRIVYANAAAAVLAGTVSARELLGHPVGRLVHSERGSGGPELVRALASGATLDAVEEEFVGMDGSGVTVEITANPVQFAGRSASQLIVRDVTARRQERRLQDAEKRAHQLLAGGAPLEQVLEGLVRDLEELTRGMVGSILMLDGNRLRHGAAPGLPEAYCRAIDGIEIGPSVGSCGTAAYRGELVVVSDIATDPLWRDFAGLAGQYGLAACWSTPIKAPDGGVLGTFAMYYREPRRPSVRELELVDRASSLAALAIATYRSFEHGPAAGLGPSGVPRVRRPATAQDLGGEVSLDSELLWRLDSADTAQEALAPLVQLLAPWFPVDRASLRRIDYPSSEVEVVAVWSRGGNPFVGPGWRLPMSSTSLPEVLRAGKPLIGDSPQSLLDQVLLGEEGIRSWVTMPIRAGELVVGLLSFSSTWDAAFRPSDTLTFDALRAAVESSLVRFLEPDEAAGS